MGSEMCIRDSACVEPAFVYDGMKVGAGDGGLPRRFDGEAFSVYARDLEAEQEMLAKLAAQPLMGIATLSNLHPQRPMDACTLLIANDRMDQTHDPYECVGDESDYAMFVQQIVPKLEEQGWHVDFSDDWPLTDAVTIDDWFVDVNASDTDWFSVGMGISCLLYTSPSPRDATLSRMPSSA